MKYVTSLALVLLASMSALAMANEPAPTSTAIGPGMQTTDWLSAQRQGTIASANPQAAKRIQRDKAAERFMKTYDFPIKESFYGDTFKTGK